MVLVVRYANAWLHPNLNPEFTMSTAESATMATSHWAYPESSGIVHPNLVSEGRTPSRTDLGNLESEPGRMHQVSGVSRPKGHLSGLQLRVAQSISTIGIRGRMTKGSVQPKKCAKQAIWTVDIAQRIFSGIGLGRLSTSGGCERDLRHSLRGN